MYLRCCFRGFFTESRFPHHPDSRSPTAPESRIPDALVTIVGSLVYISDYHEGNPRIPDKLLPLHLLFIIFFYANAFLFHGRGVSKRRWRLFFAFRCCQTSITQATPVSLRVPSEHVSLKDLLLWSIHNLLDIKTITTLNLSCEGQFFNVIFHDLNHWWAFLLIIIK